MLEKKIAAPPLGAERPKTGFMLPIPSSIRESVDGR